MRFCFDSPVGNLVLTEQENKIVGLSWNDSHSEESSPILHEAKNQLLEYFAGNRKKFNLPLSPIGTDRALKVWDLIVEIPYGETKTYGELAKILDINPRIIGRLCGANPIPILIPCHRVIGGTGSMVGYSGGKGVETKLQLLELENSYK